MVLGGRAVLHASWMLLGGDVMLVEGFGAGVEVGTPLSGGSLCTTVAGGNVTLRMDDIRMCLCTIGGDRGLSTL